MKRNYIAIIASVLGFGSLPVLKPRSIGHSLSLSLPPPTAYSVGLGLTRSAFSKDFGQSETCRRMVRKNKLLRHGIAGQRQ